MNSLSTVLDSAAQSSGARIAVSSKERGVTYGSLCDAARDAEQRLSALAGRYRIPLIVVDDDPIETLRWVVAAWRRETCAVVLRPEDEHAGAAFASALVVRASTGDVTTRGRPLDCSLPRGAVLILATSGTVGEPKLVAHSDASLVAAVRMLQVLKLEALGESSQVERSHKARAVALREVSTMPPLGLTYLSTMPISTVAGITVALQALCAGDQVAFCLPFAPTDWLDSARSTRATNASLAPPMAQALVRLLRHQPLQAQSLGLALVGIGGGAVTPALARELEELLETTVAVGYGATESGGPLTFARFADTPAVRHETVGRPLPGVDTRIREGVLEVRSPSLALGYVRTGSGEITDFRTTDGYWRTGDLAEHASSGALRLLGRIDALINRGGRNIDPVSLEHALERHAAVKRAAVVGIPNPATGTHDVIALVEAEGAVDALALKKHCIDIVGVPPQVVFTVDRLPLAIDGGIRRLDAAKIAGDLLQLR